MHGEGDGDNEHVRQGLGEREENPVVIREGSGPSYVYYVRLRGVAFNLEVKRSGLVYCLQEKLTNSRVHFYLPIFLWLDVTNLSL